MTPVAGVRDHFDTASKLPLEIVVNFTENVCCNYYPTLASCVCLEI